MSTRCKIVIPARLASTRLPQKLLRKVGNKSILQHTYEAANRATITSDVVVAVDHPSLADEVDRFGGRWVMTDPLCTSGTDRIAEVALADPNADVLINVQGDEPEIDPTVIDTVGRLIIENSIAEMATAGCPIRNRESLEDPACVKIVTAEPPTSGTIDHPRTALYFSRAAVPFCRDGIDEELLHHEPPAFWHHLGLYAYRRSFLEWFIHQPPGRLEQLEKLEQLRALEAGKTILVARVEQATAGIDTEEDLTAFEKRFEAK